jgi:hypothetical protein
LPVEEIVITSDPLVDVCEVHDEEQEEVLVEDHVSDEVSPKRTEDGSADKLTFGKGVEGID